MNREISIWIDERWYDALSRRLKNETLEEHLEDVIDEMCNQLPQREYERISALIWQEQQQAEQDREAARRLAVFRVTENESSVCFMVEEKLELLQTANRLREYIRRPDESLSARFTDMFPRGEAISREQFDAFVSERLDNTGRVTGAYVIDLDKGTFDALHIMDGWQRFRVQDVSTATYFAMKKTWAPWDERWKVLLDRLDGKQLTSPGRLTEKEISFAQEISEIDGRLNFYLETNFDVDAHFGTHVCTTDNDDWLNVYANYDMETGEVCGELDIELHRGDGSEESLSYCLNSDEREMLLKKMEAYCQEQTGMTLKEYSAQLVAEDMAPPSQQLM